METQPPRQLYDVGKPGANVALPKTGAGKIVAPFPTVMKNGKSPKGYQPVSQKERTQIDRQGKEVRAIIAVVLFAGIKWLVPDTPVLNAGKIEKTFAIQM